MNAVLIDLSAKIPTGSNAGATYLDRFWSQTERNDGCVFWVGKAFPNGYGYFYFQGREMLAHRVALSLKTGRWILSSELALHACDRPRCVNPDHLRVGNSKDNIRDCLSRKRHKPARGEHSARSKLSTSNVKEIFRLRAAGWLQKGIAEKFGVSRKQVSVILSRRQWAHLEADND